MAVTLTLLKIVVLLRKEVSALFQLLSSPLALLLLPTLKQDMSTVQKTTTKPLLFAYGTLNLQPK